MSDGLFPDVPPGRRLSGDTRPSEGWDSVPLAGAGPRGGALGAERVTTKVPNPANGLVLRRLHFRSWFAIGGFILLYMLLVGKLLLATVIVPVKPNHAAIAALMPPTGTNLPPPLRAEITDRNGVILAVSLPGAALYADSKQVADPLQAARLINGIRPALDQRWLGHRLADRRHDFVYLVRNLTASQELALNRLGIPGIYFQKTERRHYPEGVLAAHLLGGVTPDQRGIAGIESFFNKRLTGKPTHPLRLSIDVGAQEIVRQEILKAMDDYDASGACGVVMSARTGRILAMASVPGFNANGLGAAPANARFDRCVSGDYEPGSVFKLMTLAMALNSGMIRPWDRFDTTHPLHVGQFVVTDFEPVHKWLAVPHILAVSSNIGASRIATILGPTIQRTWLRKLGFFGKPPIQLPEATSGLYHVKSEWKLLTTMTVSFGNGIAMSPLQLVSAVVPVVNGGIYYKPSLLAAEPGAPPPQGVRVMSARTSLIMRKMMRNVVTASDGTGIFARVPGYLVGGKTGTAQVVGSNGRYLTHLNNASFMAAFPMNNPRYVVYVVVLRPHATHRMRPFCHGFTTGGYVAAPAVARIIARIGPMLGIMPLSGSALATAQDRLSMPLDPTAPSGFKALGSGHPFPPGASRYAYELAGDNPPAHLDVAAYEAALARTEMWQPIGVDTEIGPPAAVSEVTSHAGS